jgi:hypothetical protein
VWSTSCTFHASVQHNKMHSIALHGSGYGYYMTHSTRNWWCINFYTFNFGLCPSNQHARSLLQQKLYEDNVTKFIKIKIGLMWMSPMTARWVISFVETIVVACTYSCDQLDLVQVGLSVHVIVHFRYWIVVVRRSYLFSGWLQLRVHAFYNLDAVFFLCFVHMFAPHCGVVILDKFLVLCEADELNCFQAWISTEAHVSERQNKGRGSAAKGSWLMMAS